MKYIKVVLVALLPFAVYLLPERWIMQGHTLCLVHNLFGVECWGCGMTRALYSVAHLDFAAAWEYNHLVVVVAPLMCYIWVKWLMQLSKDYNKRG